MSRRFLLRRLSVLRRRLSVALFGLALAGAVLPALPAPAVSLDDLATAMICTVGGMLHVDPEGVPRPDRHASCLLCLPLAHAGSGALAAAAPVLASSSSGLSWTSIPRPSDRPVLARHNRQHHPRAPPISSMDV